MPRRKFQGPPEPKLKGHKSKWKDEYYIKIYELVKGGHSLNEVAEIIGVSQPCVDSWIKKKLPLRRAVEKARAGRSANTGKGNKHKTRAETFLEYVYKRLPPELQWIWDEIMADAESPKAYKRVRQLLKGQGKKTRQHLFFHALVHCNFDPSRACTLTCLSKKQLDGWLREDDFVQLMDEIYWHKKNFFEAALIKLVEEGDANAILFVNKSINRDRGYIDKQVVQVKGAIEHKHTVSIDSLNLPLETRRQVLQAVRERKRLASEAEQASARSPNMKDGNIVDAEFTKS